MGITICTRAARPELAPSAEAMPDSWDEFMRWDHMASMYFGFLDHYSEFVVYAVDDADPDTVIAKGFSVPFAMNVDGRRTDLPQDGWDRVILWSALDRDVGRAPNTVSAIEISIRPDRQAAGLSERMVVALRQNAARLGFSDFVAPVRPNRKHLEPDTPMSEYAFRIRNDGLPFDSWLRVHVRLGGVIEKVAPTSMTISGTLDEWRSWTGLPFDTSGPVHVSGALAKVWVDVDQDSAVYVEPNVWIRHPMG